MSAISQSQARALAAQHAKAGLGEFAYAAGAVLREGYLEAEHCWMFFMGEAYERPIDATLDTKWAHVVSKQGTYAMVQDFSGDAEKLKAFLQSMSDHFSVKKL